MSTPAISQAWRTVMPLGIFTGNPSTNTSMASSGFVKWTRAPPTGCFGGVKVGSGCGAAAAAEASGDWSSGLVTMGRNLAYWEERILEVFRVREANKPNPILLVQGSPRRYLASFVGRYCKEWLEISKCWVEWKCRQAGVWFPQVGFQLARFCFHGLVMGFSYDVV